VDSASNLFRESVLRGRRSKANSPFSRMLSARRCSSSALRDTEDFTIRLAPSPPRQRDVDSRVERFLA
jgi:hypothetical protein